MRVLIMLDLFNEIWYSRKKKKSWRKGPPSYTLPDMQRIWRIQSRVGLCKECEVYWPSDEAECVEVLAFCGLLLLFKKNKTNKTSNDVLGMLKWNAYWFGTQIIKCFFGQMEKPKLCRLRRPFFSISNLKQRP